MRINFFKKEMMLSVLFVAAIIVACNSNKDSDSTTSETKEQPKADMDPVARGKYLTTIGGCNDCHTPKIMTPNGPAPDTTKILSGHPANAPLPPIIKSDWVLMAPDITSFVGPWGISYTANLTPDSATGIGAWPEEVFIKTIRTGKHLGNPNGRDILPPMPWQEVAKMTDEDLKAVYAFLQSLPPINNKVPQPVAPPDVAKMMAK
jgi:hypothetical protein